MKRLFVAVVAVALAWSATPDAQKRPAPPKTPRLYVFDNGDISGLDPKIFGFAREELKSVDFVNQSYLIVHPRGTVMFDTGGIGDDKFPAGGGVAKEGIMTANKKLVPQMEAAGYTPSDVTYLVMSHYHSDHTGNANLFAGATWIVQKAERDYMFQDKPAGIIQPASIGRNAIRRVEAQAVEYMRRDLTALLRRVGVERMQRAELGGQLLESAQLSRDAHTPRIAPAARRR